MVSIVVIVIAIVMGSGAMSLGSRRAPPRPHRDVVTKQGVVRGYRTQQYYQFLGIPYAHPPLKGNRFKAPGPPPKWDGIFEATYKVHCPQPGDIDLDENCLIVNVLVPDTSEQLPVVVLVHGGEFIKRWGGDTKASKLLVKENIVVVTFNYRLGALGFLCLGEETERNAGLKDQIAVLYWIQENISKFGGNPNKVTLYGLGTGAASVHLLILSRRSAGLVHRAILESGSAISQSVLSYDSIDAARRAGTIMGLDNNATVLDILHQFENAKLQILVNLVNNNKSDRQAFLPCVEESNDEYTLVDKDPMVSMHEGVFNQIPLLFVYTNLEGLTNFSEIQINNLSDILPNNLEYPNENIKSKLMELIKEFYVRSDREEQIASYFRDIATYPILKSAMLHAKTGVQPVYVMEYCYTGSYKLNNTMEGILGNLNNDEDMDQIEQMISTKLVALHSNFIRFGDPTPLKTSLIPIIWEPVSRHMNSLAKIKVFKFDNRLMVGKPKSIKRMEFWDQIYLSFYKEHKKHLIGDEEDLLDI